MTGGFLSRSCWWARFRFRSRARVGLALVGLAFDDNESEIRSRVRLLSSLSCFSWASKFFSRFRLNIIDCEFSQGNTVYVPSIFTPFGCWTAALGCWTAASAASALISFSREQPKIYQLPPEIV